MTAPHVLIVPTHPGVQYHFCRSGLPISFLGHWDQFQYWRPRPANVRDVLPAFEDAQLDYGPDDYARLLDDHALVGWPERYDVAWLMFNWQWKLFRDRPGKKLYRVCKHAELDEREWADLFSRSDFRVASFYPNTVAWLRERFGVEVPYVPLGLDPAAYGPWEGLEAPEDERVVLSIIHSYRERGWHYASYVEAMEGLPHRHVDHLDDAQEKVGYDALRRLLRRSRLYLHDGEQEYTITLIEALMTGMPIVSFRIPGIERYVVDGENGFVRDDAKGIREACRALLEDDALAERMGRASRARALADHDEARWRRDWARILGDLVEGRA